jgi:hypothetical protein
MSERNKARNRVLTTLLMNAVLRWESFVTLLITMVLFLGVGDIAFPVVGELPAFFWLILGGAAEGALIWSTLTDPEEAREAMSRDFESKYDLALIRNSVSRERLRQAFEYRRNMMELLKSHQGALRSELRETVETVNNWIAHMYDIARHIDAVESNEIVASDLRRVPQQIEKVKIRIDREADEQVRQDLERQLELLERQRNNLEQQQNSVKRAEIQLESTLSSLGTVYAQMSLMGTKEVDSSRWRRTRLEMQDEVNRLEDTIYAMDEVQAQSLNLG